MFEFLGLPAGPQPESAAAGLIGLVDGARRFHQDAAGGEIGARNQFHQLADGGIRKLDQVPKRIAQLDNVVGWDAGRHAHRDTGGAVGQQVREGGRQHDRFTFLAVIGFPEIDGILVDGFQKSHGDFGEAGLRIAHGRRVIAVDVAEVALPFDQRIADGEFLGQAHQGIVNGGIAVGMVFTDDVADHPGAFFEARRRVQFQLAHGEQQPPVYGFQAVPHIWQGARHNGGKGVGKVPLAQGVGQPGITNIPGQSSVCHFVFRL